MVNARCIESATFSAKSGPGYLKLPAKHKRIIQANRKKIPDNVADIYWAHVKCRKFMEGTPGTLDVKSGPMRCWKGLRLQLMCCAPFRLLSQDFGTERSEIGDRKIGVKIGVDLGVETRGRIIKVRTYSIFKLNYLHDMSKVFMLSIGINKKINWKTRNKQNP